MSSFPARTPQRWVVRIEFNRNDEFLCSPLFSIAMRFQIAGTYIQCSGGRGMPVDVVYTLGGVTKVVRHETERAAHAFCMAVREVGIWLSNSGVSPELDDERVLEPYALHLGKKIEIVGDSAKRVLRQHNFAVHQMVRRGVY